MLFFHILKHLKCARGGLWDEAIEVTIKTRSRESGVGGEEALVGGGWWVQMILVTGRLRRFCQYTTPVKSLQFWLELFIFLLLPCV